MEKFYQWWNKPYHDNMTVPQWMLFVGFMIIISWLWTRVLKTLSENI
jgi:hypothetical protein